MSVGKLAFSFDSFGSVKKLIDEWKPPKLKTEGEYEKDLYQYLCDNVRGIEVVRQYGSSRIRVDICVGRKVFIELKMNLTSTAQLQRLLGQLELYAKEGWTQMIVTIVGNLEKNLVRHVTDSLKKIGGDDFLYGSATCVLVQK